MFKEIYLSLCTKNKILKEKWTRKSNLHRHHIKPKHAGGLDEEDNYTYLSIREHIIAHYLLWKIYRNPNDLRSMHMLGAKLTYEQRKIVGLWCKENNIGFFNHNKQQRKEWSKRGAMTQIHTKVGIHNPDNFKRNASLGGKSGSKSQIKQGIAIFDKSKRSEYASLGGKSLKGFICVTNGFHRTRINPEKLNEYLQNGYVIGFKLFS
jgi:hypothetical protein